MYIRVYRKSVMPGGLLAPHSYADVERIEIRDANLDVDAVILRPKPNGDIEVRALCPVTVIPDPAPGEE